MSLASVRVDEVSTTRWYHRVRQIGLAVSFAVLAACSQENAAPQPVVSVNPPADPTPPSIHFNTEEDVAHFLTQATYGPTRDDIDTLLGTSASDWFRDQVEAPASLMTPRLAEYRAMLDSTEGGAGYFYSMVPTMTWWENAIGAEDQLRQRMVFALSQILVVSQRDDVVGSPEAIVYYNDILANHAFGNYRDILQEITYSPAMGHYLTFMGNLKADPDTGRMPDENYAREIMQLFTIGLVELNMDGTPRLENGETVETYTNEDITGLARVFTGLELDYARNGDQWDPILYGWPMVSRDWAHEEGEKTFLGLTIPANTDADTSISMALDHLMAHPNVAPFLARQFIQRFTTSNPSPAYIRHVAEAFETGRYMLPDGSMIGSGEKGDLETTIAAVLFHPEARWAANRRADTYGKIREPVIRFANFVRAFEFEALRVDLNTQMWHTDATNQLAQQAYRAPSVFNFYRPGYVPPGTESGAAGLTLPEMQLVNATSTPGYINWMTWYVTGGVRWHNPDDLQRWFDESGINIDASLRDQSFLPDFSREIALAEDPPALVDHLDLLLTYGTLSQSTRDDIISLLDQMSYDVTNPDDEGLLQRVRLAVLMILTSPDYLVQR